MAKAEGLVLQEAAIAQLLVYRQGLIAQCRQAMVTLYQERLKTGDMPFVSGDDACLWLDDQGCEQDYRLIGAVFRTGSGWAPAGRMNSSLKRRHHREIRCWRWVGLGS